MRKWINASNLLLEAGLINTNQNFVFRWKMANGQVCTHETVNAKEDIVRFWHRDIPAPIEHWSQTNLLNFMKKMAVEGPHVFSLSMPIMTFLDQVVADQAFGDSERTPDPTLYGDGERDDYRFVNDLLEQLPEWAREGEVLFPWGSEACYMNMEDEPPVIGGEIFVPSEVYDYLMFRVERGDNIERMSVPDAIRLSNQWHNSVARKNLVDTENDIKTVMDFGDGYKVVRLLTANALDRESAMCSHCVGKGGYDALVATGTVKIFSLRDRENTPLATIEVSGKKITQVKGKGNGAVNEDVHNHVMKFILGAGLQLAQDHTNLGLSRVSID